MIDTEMVGIAALAVTNIAVIAATWGDMRRQVSANKERQDERHRENQEMLHEIRDDVKRINGTVARHEAELTQRRSKPRTRRSS